MSDGLNKYLHGTVWVYPVPEKKRGVKRLALVVSSSQANTNAPTVNVVPIVSGAADSYTCVPLNIDQGYQIQCDQIHTVMKEDLTEYSGALSSDLLSTVKSKICTHLSLGEEIESKAALRKALSTMTETLTKLVAEDEAIMQPAVRAAEKPPKQPKKVKSTPMAEPDATPDAAAAAVPPKPAKKAKGIAGRKPKAAKAGNTDKPKRTIRKYTDEEKAFISDTANSAEDIMKRFELKDKKTAHALRNYIRNRLGKQEKSE